MATNKLTRTANVAIHSVMAAKILDKDGNEKTILPTTKANVLDLTGISGNGNSGDTGGGDNPDHPDAGADYYAGSLADGEITERYLLYQRHESVAEEPTTPKTVTLLKDVGTKFNMAGDGATLLLHLQKTLMTAGAKGTVSDVELNYDTNNVAKDGYFTTTSPYPIYIKASDLATKKTLAIPINGIGENLSGKNVKAPQLNVTFNGNGTMTFESATGYDNDGSSAGATGANYDVVVDVIATFSTQNAIAQIPPSINFFAGSACHDVVLSGATDFFENTMNGLQITFDDHFQGNSTNIDTNWGYKIESFGIPQVLNVDKKLLINGYKLKLNSKRFSGYQKGLNKKWGTWEDTPGVNNVGVTLPDRDYYLIFGKGTINFDTGIDIVLGSSNNTDYVKLNVLNIKSYN
ncbi:hypothetical protein [Companilactobacillus muriivasis]|uniref:hypothetical protein n=1 Tax=Companilactobacillus muriivasis TaxID=3081444 RepID=UPI0030C6B867